MHHSNDKDLANLQLSANNKRVDNFTRGTIDMIQSLFFDPSGIDSLLNNVLKYLMGITISDHGACFTGDNDAYIEKFNQMKLQSISNASQFVVNFDELAKYLDKQQKFTKPNLYECDRHATTAFSARNSASITAVLLVPLFVHNNLRAIFALAKTKNQFPKVLTDRMYPVLGAAACALHNAETVVSDGDSIDRAIYDSSFFDHLVSNSPSAMLVVDANAEIVVTNPKAIDLFCPGHADSQAKHEQSTLHGVDIHQLIPNYEELFKWSNQQNKYGENDQTFAPQLWDGVNAYTLDGEERTASLTIFKYAKGIRKFTVLQIIDTTSVDRENKQFKQSNEQLHLATQLSPIALIQVNTDWDCTLINEKWEQLSGMTRKESMGKGWINAMHPEDVQGVLELLRLNLQNGIDFQTELRFYTSQGSIKWVDISVRILISADGAITGFLACFVDVTDRHVDKEQLRIVAEVDALTGLTNRNKFLERLEYAIAASSRNNSMVTVFFLDLDGFKDVNDNLGHEAGDIVLQNVAGRLNSVLRKTDTVARFGGDEFVVLLGPDYQDPDIVNVAQKIIDAVSRPFEVNGKELFLTTSLGVSQSQGENEVNEIIKQADSALYRAKRAGKNRVEIYDNDLDGGNRARAVLKNELRAGLRNDMYYLTFQPIYCAKRNVVSGFETLIRFKSQRKEEVLPSEFIQLLEETNHIVDVGKWVIQRTCQQLSTWNKQGLFGNNTYISFNVSAKELLDSGFVFHLAQCISKHKVNPKNLVMEITESVIINQSDTVLRVLNDVKDLGIRIALDDFGTGYSSLSYLQRFPIDIIKIDRSFVHDLSSNTKNSKITQAIVVLAKSFDLLVIAEGVENQTTLDTVKQLGADYIQGYFYSKAISAKKIEKYLQDVKKVQDL